MPSVPDPEHVKPWYLRNITEALALDELTGNVYVRTNTSIIGNVTIGGTIESHITELGNIDISGNTMPATVYQGTDPWIISGDANVTGTVTIQDGGSSITVDGTITTVPDNSVATLVKYADSENMQMDATDRLRVSQGLDTWWYAPSIDNDTNYRYIESYSGTGAGSVFIQNLASVSLSSGTTLGGTYTRISRKRHKLRPTASVRVSMSLNWNGFDANVRQRAGLFTNFNGTFFQADDDLHIVVRRRLANGTLVEKVIDRADFNIDPLDGTISQYDLRPNGVDTFTSSITGWVSTTPVSVGATTVYDVVFTVADRSKFYPGLKGRVTGIDPSTFNQVCMVESVSGATGPGNITVTYLINPGVYSSMSSALFNHDALFKQMVFGFDFNGNRNGHIRYFINGMYGRQVVHIENFDGPLSTPWSNAPAVSTKYELTNVGSPAYRPSVLISSETVTIEAPPHYNRAFGTAYNNTYIEYDKNQQQEYALLGMALRVGEPYQRADLQVNSFQIIDVYNINPQNAGVLFWRLLLNPTIGGTVPASTNIGRASRQWAYTAATTVSGGIELASGYCTQSTIQNIATDPDFVNMGSNIAYDDSDKLVLVVKMLAGGSANSRLVAQMNFVEML